MSVLSPLAIRRARPDEAGLVLSLVRELAEYEKLSHEVEATAAILRHRGMEWRCGRLRGLVHQFFHLQRPFGNLSGRPVRAPCAARQRDRQGSAVASCEAMRDQRLVAPAVVGAGLEYALD